MDSKEKIEAIANTLLPGFIPKNKEETELSFHFTIPPDSNYKVTFKKDSRAMWQYHGFLSVEKDL